MKMESADVTWILLSVVVSLIFYGFLKLMERYEYWKKRGISYLKPQPIFGNVISVILMKKSITDIYKEAYFKFPNERVVGIYEFSKPVLILRDENLIERILVKDFQYFMDRPIISEEGGLFNQGLFQLKGAPWRSLRYKISPAFSSGKIKGMFEGMLECSEEMLRSIDQNLNKDYAVSEAIGIYMTEVIAETVFGVKLNDRQTIDRFITLGSTIFNTTPLRFIHTFLLTQFPNIANWLGFTFLPEETENYFKNLLLRTVKQREDGAGHRNDYTQQLLTLKQVGVIEVKTKEKEDAYLDLDSPAPREHFEITDDLLAGQAFQFLSAGFDPLMITVTYVMYDLCRFPEIQELARKHVMEVLDKHQGYTYDCMKDMTYLEQCIQESLRLHTVALSLYRLCTKRYYIPEENLEVFKGQKIVIPINALHIDPKHYPEPEVYKPERLPPNSMKSNFTYLPFGDGPRICIGIRYAMIVLKLGLSKILSNYKFTLSPKTDDVPLEFNKQSFIRLPKNALLFNISKIK